MEKTSYANAEEILIDDFISLVKECRKAGIEPVLIGFYAIRLHIGRARPTNDLDIWINHDGFAYISYFLERLGYKVTKTPTMFQAVKEGGIGKKSVIHILKGEPKIETHIVGIILEADRPFFHKGFLRSTDKGIEVTHPSLEGCLILKLWSMDIQKRPQDVIDIMNFLIYRATDIDSTAFRKKILRARLPELSEILKQQIERVARWLGEGRADTLWQDFEGRRLLDKEKRLITSTLKNLLGYL